LREFGISVTAYGVLSRGLLSGRVPDPGTKADIRVIRMPRFQAGNLDKNLALVQALQNLGEAKGATPAQLAIAWVRSRGDDIVPVVGARRRDQLRQALGAIELRLDADDLKRIEAAVPQDQIAGARYDPTQMAHLDSERHG
jgi:aryl-alcohol dehydrogenase-like predicted oxidoreductase